MKAAVRTRYGPPDVVQIAEIPTPSPGGNDLLVKVFATTVNRTDCAYRTATPWIVRTSTGLTKPKIAVLGTEFAGEVTAVGSAVTLYAAGDRVFGYCEGLFGAHAEYLTVRQDSMVARMPSNLSFAEAAPASEGAHYAQAFIARAKIRADQSVLVNGATGAIGSAAVQLLKNLGVSVTAVCSTENVVLVRRLGADRVIDYTAGDFTADSGSYDVIIDAVGKTTFGRCKHLLTPNGIYSSAELGPYAQNLVLAFVTPPLRRRRVVFPLPVQSAQLASRLATLMETNVFTPVIDRRYPLDDIITAYRYVDSGRKVGNVVITVAQPA